MYGNIKTCEKVVTSYIIATFENWLHQLCHKIFRQTYRSVPVLVVPKTWKAIEQVFCLRVSRHPGPNSKLIQFIWHVLNKSAPRFTWK